MTDLNQYITTNQFFELYPEIPTATFWRWTNSGKRVRKDKKWSETYILKLQRLGKGGHFISVLIPLPELKQFFLDIGEEELASRVPSYIKL